jgi:hypothetical protein
MIGLDTNVLVAHAIPDHPSHGKVRERIDRFLTDGHDPRRFEKPLTMAEALEWAGYWSDAEEVGLEEHRFGRKRLLDSLIAATWHAAGVWRFSH